MNERIKELALLSGFDIDTNVSFAEKTRLHCFAELIIQESCQALWTKECHMSDLAVEEFNRNSKKIKRHFGVE